jgi:putative membrane protein
MSSSIWKEGGEPMMMGFGWLGLILLLLFWMILIAGAVWLMKSIFPGVSQSKDSVDLSQMSAREILDQRYARGELTREHYLAMVEDLNEGGQ